MDTIVRAKNKNKAKDLAHGLFTKTERVMLAKRLAIILLLESGATSYEVEQTLKVSSSTVLRIMHALEAGAYNRLVSGLGDKGRTSLLDLLGAILAGESQGKLIARALR